MLQVAVPGRRPRSPRRGRGVCVLLMALAVARTSAAQDRTFVDVEPLTPRFAMGGHTRVSVATLGVTVGWGADRVLPYVGGGLGFFTMQARAGVSVLPNGLTAAGLLLRAEARPQLLLSCAEPALFGNLGLGYRWPLEPSYPDVRPGAAFYLLPAFDGGEAWVRPNCGATGPAQAREPRLFLGGTVALGLDL